MIFEPFSIDPSGTWSDRQVKKVLEVLEPEARQRGLYFRRIDVTTHNMPHRRYLLQAFCLKHDCVVALDSVCERCRWTI